MTGLRLVTRRVTPAEMDAAWRQAATELRATILDAATLLGDEPERTT